ncbi:unnamed protein product [Nyctereutes procyonoides]|uniref:(raccoon dog) hypothetical protein n=1 Tax=Nyctereutes procyonoides TaxID=34880 RepID=A0A811YZ47_NYCPR|nr:unnamed protein product [Nyctereutes procyonoides]
MMHVIIIVVSEHGFWISALSTFVSGYFPVVGVSCASQDIEQHLWSPSTRCNSSPSSYHSKNDSKHCPYLFSFPHIFFYHLKFYPNITENKVMVNFKRNGSHQSCFTTDRLSSNARESGMGANEDSAIQDPFPGSLETQVPGTGPAPPTCSLPGAGPRGGPYGMPPSKNYFQLECKGSAKAALSVGLRLGRGSADLPFREAPTGRQEHLLWHSRPWAVLLVDICPEGRARAPPTSMPNCVL